MFARRSFKLKSKLFAEGGAGRATISIAKAEMRVHSGVARINWRSMRCRKTFVEDRAASAIE